MHNEQNKGTKKKKNTEIPKITEKNYIVKQYLGESYSLALEEEKVDER